MGFGGVVVKQMRQDLRVLLHMGLAHAPRNWFGVSACWIAAQQSMGMCIQFVQCYAYVSNAILLKDM